MKHSQPEPTDSAVSKPHDDASMIQRELERGAFPDERLGKRLGRLLEQFADGTAESVPFACQDWASTKTASGPSEPQGHPDRKPKALDTSSLSVLGPNGEHRRVRIRGISDYPVM